MSQIQVCMIKKAGWGLRVPSFCAILEKFQAPAFDQTDVPLK